MNRFFKWVLWVLLVVAIGLFLYSFFVENIFSKRLSPKDKIEFTLNDLDLKVQYNRPYKKGREIFGGLVPYDQVWRTGANEATTFETNKPLYIQGIAIPKGIYTLWTIPSDSSWNVILNTKLYPWGVDEQMKPMREPQYDILEIEVPVESLNNTVEQFTIGFDNTTGNLDLTMAWDQTKVAVPISVKKDTLP
ncbi:DUF2911 domain-containing protein [Mangrovimonas sp. DI 80]|uniref:DUF2911 domain-containing protein n=1 Tax=Mangrovimonas sp. DI 80 TaxID=1779330 RepID=UPI0009787FB0|nr:DUF2911 domain-containing protein [Mangrovimonas sp. DI 80]OMP31138.1 hypothetical protein BKM32_08725 [Mangrovimonas sp. DI 80]